MARQEATSIFSDGLMSDLHPINTPKSVLTDCLNGTYVTYNGNEFILQNDMGNYKLQNCKLPTNFIPVGVKGYADILYIVSYNPITKEVEIGSYPSPQTIQAAGDGASKLLEYYSWTGTETYPQLSSKDKPLVLFVEDNEEAVKMYPGDEFYLETEPGDDLTPNYIYQHLDYYIVDEDKKLYNLDDADFESRVKDENNFSKVFWETPGWLAAKWRLYVPDRFNLNIRSLNVPEFLLIDEDEIGTDTQTEESTGLRDQEAEPGKFKVSLDLSSQTTIMDTLFQKTLNDNDSDNDNVNNNDPVSFNHLFIRYLIRTSSTTETDREWGTVMGMLDSNKENPETESETTDEYEIYDIPCYRHNYQDDIITAYNNIYIAWSFTIPQTNGEVDLTNFNGSVEVTAFPIIKMEGISTLEFRQFETTQRFDLDNIKDSRDIKIADSTYKWSVDDDSCTLSFNINGPFVNASNITGRYEIYRLNMFDWTDGEPTYKAKTSKSTWNDVILTQNTDRFGYLEKITDPNIKNRTFVELNGIDKDSSQLKMSAGKPGNLLMLSEDIPNIVLYGQNTINIGWENSNVIKFTEYKNWYSQDQKYETLTPLIPNISIGGSIGTLPVGGIIGGGNSNISTTLPGINLKPLEQEMILDENNTSKTISFEKEGGLYVFRVIIEQDGKSIAKQDSLLIPSEVFNEFFGSVDNYNNITGDTWINKYADLISYDGINLQNLSIELNPSEDDKFLEYKWASDNDWKLLDRATIIKESYPISWGNSTKEFQDYVNNDNVTLTTTQCLGLIYWIKDSNFVTYTFDTSKPNNSEEKLIFSWKESETQTKIENLQIRYNYELIKDKTITWDSNQTLAKVLHGNLWNPVINTTVALKTNTTSTGLQIIDDGYKSEFNLKTLNTIQNFSIDKKELDGYTKKYRYPILDDIIKGYTFGIELYVRFSTQSIYTTGYHTQMYQLNSATIVKDRDEVFHREYSGEDGDNHYIPKSDAQLTFGWYMRDKNLSFVLGTKFFEHVRVVTGADSRNAWAKMSVSTNDHSTSTASDFINEWIPYWTGDDYYSLEYSNLLFVRCPSENNTNYIIALDLPWNIICGLCRLYLAEKDKETTFYGILLNWDDTFSQAISYTLNQSDCYTEIKHLRVDDYIWKKNSGNLNLLNINSITSQKKRTNISLPAYPLTIDLNNNIFINISFILNDFINNNNNFWKTFTELNKSEEFLFVQTDEIKFREYLESKTNTLYNKLGWFYILDSDSQRIEGESAFSKINRQPVYMPWNSSTEHGRTFYWELNEQSLQNIITDAKVWFGDKVSDWSSVVFRQSFSDVIKGIIQTKNGSQTTLSYCYYRDYKNL